MRALLSGLSTILIGASLVGCSTKHDPCPSAGQSFRPLALGSSLADWDHASVTYDGTQVMVSYTQGALGNAGASSVWMLPVSCGGEVSSPTMLSRSLATGTAPALTQNNDATWVLWSLSSDITTTEEETDGGTADAGTADAGAVDAGTTAEVTDGGTVKDPVRGGFIPEGEFTPLDTDIPVSVTRLGAAYERATSVYQVIGGSAALAFAGSRALGTDGACQAPFVQRFTADGVATVEQPDLDPSDALGCLVGPTAIAGVADELFYLAWTQRPANDAQSKERALLYSNWSTDRSTLSSATTVTVSQVSAPSVSTGAEAKSPPQYLAYSVWDESASKSTLRVLDMSRSSVGAAVLEVPLTAEALDRPLVAGGENGGALAWTEVKEGARKMVVQPFTYKGGVWSADAPAFDLSTRAGVTTGRIEAITHLTGTSYFVVWSQSRSSTERSLLQGGFVTF